MMYAWASPDYILDHMSFDQVMMYYEKGIKATELNAKVFWGVFGQAMSGTQPTTTPSPNMCDSDKPDLAAFHQMYGNNIKRG